MLPVVFCSVLGVLLIVALVVRYKVYDTKIERAFKAREYESALILILKRQMFFGSVLATSKYYELSLKYVFDSGKLFKERENNFLDQCKKVYCADDEEIIILLLHNIVSGIGYSLPKTRKTALKELSEELQKLLSALQAYSDKEYEQYFDKLASVSIQDINIRTIVTYLALKINPDYEVLPDLQQSIYYCLIEEVVK